jgi:tetratricopeptide (TPR) repeat protein
MRRGLFRMSAYSPVMAVLIAVGLLLIQPQTGSGASAAVMPQGKGGTIKPVPTPVPAAKKTPQPKRSAPTTRTTRQTPSKSGNSDATEITFWNSIKDSTDPEDFKAYLEQYPNGKFSTLAKNRLRNLEGEKAKPPLSIESEASKTQTRPNAQPTSTTLNTASPAQPNPSNAVEAKEDAPGHFEKGKDLNEKKKFTDAEAELRLAVRLDPGKVEYRRALASSLLVQCKYAELAAESREIVRIEPTGDNYFGLYAALESEGKLTEAEIALREAIRLKPDWYSYHTRLGWLLARQERLPEAVAAFKEILRVSSNPAEGHQSYGWALLGVKKYPEAEREFREAVRLRSKEEANGLDHVYLSRALAHQNKWAEAEAEIREGIRLYRDKFSTTQATFWDELARIYEDQGKLAKAESVYKEALILFPQESYGLHVSYGDFLTRQKRWVEAEAEYRQTTHVIKLGHALKEQNKLTEAESQYRQALQTNPADADARLNLADSLERQNRLKEAETEYRTLIGSNCSDGYAFVHSGFGDFLGRRNRWKEAEAQYRRAAQLNPKEPKYQEKLQQATNAQKK